MQALMAELMMEPPAMTNCLATAGRSMSSSRGTLRYGALPQLSALFDGWHWKLDDGPEPPQEGFVDVLLQVGGQDCAALKHLKPLEQEAHLLVGEAVLSLLDLASTSEERVGLVRGAQPSRLPRRRRPP